MENYISFKRDKNFDIDEAIREYKQTKDIELRNRIVEECLGMVVYIAGVQGYPKQIEKNDLINSGVVGLIKAIDLYEPDREALFTTYAFTAIDRKMKDDIAMWYGEGMKEHGDLIRKYIAMATEIFGNYNDIYDEETVDYVLEIMIEKDELKESYAPVIRKKLLKAGLESIDKRIIESIESDDKDGFEYEFIENHKYELFAPLTKLERDIIRSIFKGHKLCTLAEKYNVSRITICSYEQKALQKMKTVVDKYI